MGSCCSARGEDKKGNDKTPLSDEPARQTSQLHRSNPGGSDATLSDIPPEEQPVEDPREEHPVEEPAAIGAREAEERSALLKKHLAAEVGLRTAARARWLLLR